MKKNSLTPLLVACLGFSITTLTFAGANTATTAPSKTGIPLAIDIWDTGCVIKYRTPQNNGGEAISNYYIEHRGVWDLAWKFRGKTTATEYQFKGMKTKTKAQFRVSAANAVGISTPSTSSDFITFR